MQKVFMDGLWIYQQQRLYLTENSMLCYGPLVSELGGQSAWCPQPRHWGACAPRPPAPPPMVPCLLNTHRRRLRAGGRPHGQKPMGVLPLFSLPHGRLKTDIR